MNADAFLDRHQESEWLITTDGQPRGYIQPKGLQELWFHTGTICNLRCPFCLEGSKPGDKRLEPLTLADVRPFVQEALALDVKQFCFTGGEPFVIRDIIPLLSYALDYRPCLILTNGTAPLSKRFKDVLSLRDKPNPLKFRISLDFPNPEKHDAGRGAGTFRQALESAAALYRTGFNVSIARQAEPNERAQQVNEAYRRFFESVGLPTDLHIVAFPELFTPCATVAVPDITESCMVTYKDEQSRAAFMCSYSKMVVKEQGRMLVYPCTLVDDDPDYRLDTTLTQAMRYRVMLKHHRCFACFSLGASCSEPLT